MKKKVSIVWVLIVAIMVLFMTGCHDMTIGTAPTEVSNKLEFEERGRYVKAKFSEEFYVYRFDEPNSKIVVYETLDGIFIVGEDATEEGISYGNVFMPGRKFVGISNKYFLFETEEGKIAVEIEKKKHAKKGEGLYNEHFYEEMSDEEKNAFIYPIESKKEKWKSFRVYKKSRY